jgi:hypothetical protein
MYTEFWCGIPSEISSLEDLEVDGKIILRFFSGKSILRIIGEWK